MRYICKFAAFYEIYTKFLFDYPAIEGLKKHIIFCG